METRGSRHARPKPVIGFVGDVEKLKIEIPDRIVPNLPTVGQIMAKYPIEIEANRDYYGPARFDDIEFQMSARGQQLQSRFVESYADRLQDDIEADLSLPDFAPVSRPGIRSAGQVRARGAVGSAGGPSVPDAPDRSGITDEVERIRQQGRGRIGTVRGYLDRQTEGATGASEEAADDVKEWGNR